MRKADYAILAQLLAENIKPRMAIYANPSTVEVARQTNRELLLLTSIAHGFAHGASVEKSEFLKACGIE